MIRVTAYDLDGVPRCYGDGKTEATARKQCEWAVKEYHDNGHRPDVILKPENFKVQDAA